MRVALIVFLLGLSPAYAGKAGDAYTAYVNEVIPAANAIVDHQAKLRELALFVELSSAGQAALVGASQDLRLLDHYLKQFEFNEGACPGTRDLVDVSAALAQLFFTTQAYNFAVRAGIQLGTYEKTAAAIKESCEKEGSFADYKVDNLSFVFFLPPNVPYEVNAKFAVGGTAASRAGEMGLPIITDIINFFDRKSDNEAFEKGRDTILSKQPTDKTFQEAAKKHCREIREGAKAAIEGHALVGAASRAVLKGVDATALQGRENFLRECVAKSGEQLATLITEEAKAKANAKLAPEREYAANLITSSDTKKRILTGLRELAALPCDKGILLESQIETNLTLLRYLPAQISTRHTFVPEAARKFEALRTKRQADCAEKLP